MIRVASLHVYPVKGLRGLSPCSWPVEARGLRLDRRWMLIDENGQFMSQRNTPRMCLFRPELAGDRLRICSPNGESLDLPPTPEGEPLKVTVWQSECDAVRVSDEADAWLSRHFEAPVRLVFMPNDSIRQTNLEYTRPGDHVGFADAFPILVASTASLDDLNARMAEPLPMNRFRPNVVVEGCAPFAEDEWPSFTQGGIPYRAAKRCARCKVTATNQDTAEVGVEPLRTLATFRREDGKVYFGAYFVPESEGTIAVGDTLEPAS